MKDEKEGLFRLLIKTCSIIKFLLIAVAQRWDLCIHFLNRHLQNLTCLNRNFTVFTGSSICAKNPQSLNQEHLGQGEKEISYPHRLKLRP